MIADLNIIKRKEDNLYAYVLLTTRPYENGTFGNKNRDWSHKKTLLQWREAWAMSINEALYKAGFEDIKVDHRSFADQGIKRMPQPHIGKAAFHANKRGDKLERWVNFEEAQKANASNDIL